MMGEAKYRFWDVDALRGIAIIMVVLYHLIYDLDNFGGYGIESTSGFWGAFADVSAFMFVFLVGLSLTLSYSRTTTATGESTFGKYLLRGLKIFAYGMLITLVFWAADFGAVIIGILHLIGLSIILAYPFLRFKLTSLLAGFLVIAVGAYIQAQSLVVEGTAGVLLARWEWCPRTSLCRTTGRSYPGSAWCCSESSSATPCIWSGGGGSAPARRPRIRRRSTFSAGTPCSYTWYTSPFSSRSSGRSG
jgi:uncharacterized membrane protein